METKKLLILIGVVVAGAVAFFWLRPDNNERIISKVVPRAAGADITIVAFGDSLTAGYSLPENEAYPAKLEAALKAEGKSVKVINAGVSGETTRGNLERAEFIRRQNPDIVLLGIGGNDALRQLSLDEAKKNITETIKILNSVENPPVVVLLTMQAPLNAGLAYKKTFDAMYSSIAEEQNVILAPFLTTEVFLNSDNKISDGIHLNATGYGIVVDEYLMPVVLPLVEQMES
jgi:acyl-CoA thioesterase I